MEARLRRLEAAVEAQAEELQSLRVDHEALKRAYGDGLGRSASPPPSSKPRAPAATAAQGAGARAAAGGRAASAGAAAAPSLGASHRSAPEAALEPLSPSLGSPATGFAAGSEPSPSPSRGEHSLSVDSSRDIFPFAKPLLAKRTKDSRQLDEALQAVEEALSQGGSPNAWSGPATPLAGAVISRNLDFVELLLQAGAEPDAPDDRGVSPLHSAAFDGLDLICKALLHGRADVNVIDPHQQTPIFFSPTRAVCETLYRARSDINAMNTMGQSPLHLAAKAGLSDAVLWLCSRQSRAIINLRDCQGKQAEEYATAAGCRREVIESIRHAGGGDRTRPNKAQSAKRRELAPGEDPGDPLPGDICHAGGYEEELAALGLHEPAPAKVYGNNAAGRAQKKQEESQLLARNAVLQAQAMAKKRAGAD